MEEIIKIEVEGTQYNIADLINRAALGGNVQSIEWSYVNNINNYLDGGLYHIKGERTGDTDNLPIMNVGSGHTIDGMLYVLDSSINESEVCVTQVLILSNRVGGEGHIFIRTGNATSKDDLLIGNGWSTWAKQQGIFEKNQINDVTEIDSYTTNGMYSGVVANEGRVGSLKITQGSTILLITINGYAAVPNDAIPAQGTQLLYVLPLGYDATQGTASLQKAHLYLRTGIWVTSAFSWADWTQIDGVSGGGTSDSVEIVNDLTTGGADKALSAEMGKELKEELSKKTESISNNEEDKFLITDKEGNILAEFSANGLSTLNVYVKREGEIVGIKEWLESMSNLQDTQDAILDRLKDTLYITDNEGNVLAKFNDNGLEVSSVVSPSILPNDWSRKILTTYGDSVTALQGGDFDYPYNLVNTQKWGNRVADYFKMSKHYGRGIGGQRYAWKSNGGSITWLYKDTGILYNRNDSFNFDDWDGVSFPEDWTDGQKNTVLNGLKDGSIVSIRGCACSWLRITNMYPESIKDEIDVVFVMFHNDGIDGTEFSWVEGDTTDPEWAASNYYDTYGGDYNINTMEGGLASTIMKLQAWMPQAIIVVGTPISGRADGNNASELNQALKTTLFAQCKHVKNVANQLSIPVIDVYATCGINGLNRTKYITDTIHPYSVAGSKMIARAIIGGLKTILPNY